jgi:hypothetical protein
MPQFFRNIYPFLPFTYGIDAMRETIASFYGAHWWRFMGALAIFVVLAWIVGLVLRRRLAYLNRLFNREVIDRSLIGEDVQVVGRGYRLTDVIHALADRGEFRDRLDRRARRRSSSATRPSCGSPCWRASRAWSCSASSPGSCTSRARRSSSSGCCGASSSSPSSSCSNT